MTLGQKILLQSTADLENARRSIGMAIARISRDVPELATTKRNKALRDLYATAKRLEAIGNAFQKGAE